MASSDHNCLPPCKAIVTSLRRKNVTPDLIRGRSPVAFRGSGCRVKPGMTAQADFFDAYALALDLCSAYRGKPEPRFVYAAGLIHIVAPAATSSPMNI